MAGLAVIDHRFGIVNSQHHSGRGQEQPAPITTSAAARLYSVACGPSRVVMEAQVTPEPGQRP